MLRRSVMLVLLVAAMVVSSNCSRNPTISTMSLPDGAVGQRYSFQMEGHYVDRWVVSQGNLPPGLQLTDGGRIMGTPTLVGQYVFTIRALKDGSFEVGDAYNVVAPSNSVDQSLVITIR